MPWQYLLRNLRSIEVAKEIEWDTKCIVKGGLDWEVVPRNFQRWIFPKLFIKPECFIDDEFFAEGEEID